MVATSLVAPWLQAGADLVRELEHSTPVIAAFWLRMRESGSWKLYIAFDVCNGLPHRSVYEEVRRLAQVKKGTGLDRFKILFVNQTDPAVQAAIQHYKNYPPRVPMWVSDTSFGGLDVDEIYLIQGPLGECPVPSGREVLDHIIDQESAFFRQHGRVPLKIKLPILMAYDLAKCGRNELGEISGRVFKDGISAFEKEGFHGLSVEIIREPNAALQLE